MKIVMLKSFTFQRLLPCPFNIFITFSKNTYLSIYTMYLFVMRLLWRENIYKRITQKIWNRAGEIVELVGLLHYMWSNWVWYQVNYKVLRACQEYLLSSEQSVNPESYQLCPKIKMIFITPVIKREMRSKCM